MPVINLKTTLSQIRSLFYIKNLVKRNQAVRIEKMNLAVTF